MKAQTSVEILILISAVIILAGISASIIFDLPSVFSNFKDKFNNDAWQLEDIGIIGHSFNYTKGRLFLVNNLDYPINLTNITLNSVNANTETYILYPSESKKVWVNYNSDLNFDYYSFEIRFDYINMENSRAQGFYGSQQLIGDFAKFN